MEHKTLICIPCMDTVPTTFFLSMMGLKKTGLCSFANTTNSLVYDARNQLAKRAVDGDYERILWLDSDMQFEPDLMERLSADLDEGRDIVSGLYFTRRAEPKPVLYSRCGIYRTEDGEEVRPIAEHFADYPRDQIFKIEACGFGAVMMTTQLMKRVIEVFGQPFAPIYGFGEDLSFCMRVQELGVPIFCDSRVKLGHVGLRVISEEQYRGGA